MKVVVESNDVDMAKEVKRRKQAHHGFKKIRTLFETKLEGAEEEAETEVLRELHRYSGLVRSGHFDINAPINASKRTLLHTAVFHMRPKVVEWLLRNGATTDVITQQGNTPLHFACERMDQSNAKEVAELLIAHGADGNLQNLTDKATPIDKAAQFNHRNFIEAAIAKRRQSAPLQDQALEASQRGSSGAASIMSSVAPSLAPSRAASRTVGRQDPEKLAKGVELKRRLQEAMDSGSDGETLAKQIDMLLKAGKTLLMQGYTDIKDVVDAKTNTSLLHIASQYGSVESVTTLISLEFDPNQGNFKGNTPLHFAALRNENYGGVEVNRTLIGAGADASIKNFTEGKSAIDKSVSTRIRDMLRSSVSATTSDQSQINNMLQQAQATSDTLTARMQKDQMYHEELLAAKLQSGGGGQRRRANKMLSDALEEDKELQQALKKQMGNQDDALQAKLASMKRSKEMSSEAEKQLLALATDAAAVNTAVGHARKQSDMSFLDKLQKGKKNKWDKKTTALLDELGEHEDKKTKKIKGALSNADDDLFSKLKQGRRSRAQKNIASELPEQEETADEYFARQLEQDALGEHIFDTNIEDPTISEETRAMVVSIFNLLDRQKSGRLYLQRLLEYHRELHQCQLLFSKAHDFVGHLCPLSIDRFLEALITLHKKCNELSSIQWSFRLGDTDRDGIVELSLAQALVAQLQSGRGDRHSIQSKLQTVGEPQSGYVSQDTIIQLLLERESGS